MKPEEKAEIHRRYFRKVMAYPDGAVVHYGDCNIWRNNFCDCGLLKLLQVVEGSEEIYPDLYKEMSKHNEIADTLFEHKHGREQALLADDRTLKHKVDLLIPFNVDNEWPKSASTTAELITLLEAAIDADFFGLGVLVKVKNEQPK